MAGGDFSLDAAWTYLCGHCEDPYEHQVDAVEALVEGKNVVLTTPTGSGKSLVAESAMQGLRSGAPTFRTVWTAPVKALVNDHYRRLSTAFGSEDVGISTGDVRINPGAPILCCTAEILANHVLREGCADADLIVMDEFHYYGDAQRGWAWQVPLLVASPPTQFLLMSATVGPTAFFRQELTRRTGRESVEVTGQQRPVELCYSYRDTRLGDSIDALLHEELDPVYVVHFDRFSAMRNAQSWRSRVKTAHRDQLREHIAKCTFDTPVGRKLQTLLEHGVAVHHSGLLPKYRRLVETLAQERLLTLICGTDTLGVGINLPIKSVLFTGLAKWDGKDSRLVDVREFRQIAGRAGRRGFDAAGHVWVQAPEHEIENRIEAEKAAAAGRRHPRRKLTPTGPQWSASTFTDLQTKECPPLRSAFTITAHMVTTVLDRPPKDGLASWDTLAALIRESHGTENARKKMAVKALEMYQSLLEASILELLEEPDDLGRRVRIRVGLQEEFALSEPLALFAQYAIAALDKSRRQFALDVLSVVESVLADPRQIVIAQSRRARREAHQRLAAEDVDGVARLAELDKAVPAPPLADYLEEQFRMFHERHTWVDDKPSPKSVVRELFELGASFNSYVERYDLSSYEGEVLTYLNSVLRALVRMVPEEVKTDALRELVLRLDEIVRTVDSSLMEE